jgi:hypothetical protein
MGDQRPETRPAEAVPDSQIQPSANGSTVAAPSSFPGCQHGSAQRQYGGAMTYDVNPEHKVSKLETD